ncbi:MAG: MarR family winged helix-turn-helix transcriptional regulator [Thermomicrobiales bacterium]
MAEIVETEAIVAAPTLRSGNMMEMPKIEEPGELSDRLRGTIDAMLVLMPVLTRKIAAMAYECPLGNKPTLPQVRVMTVVSARGKATVSAIADALELSRPATSEMIDRMVEIGYVSREVNPADRRQVLISLTPPAAETMDGIVAQRRALLLESLGDLSDDELAGFLKGMRGFTRTIAPEVMADPLLAPVCGQLDVDAVYR